MADIIRMPLMSDTMEEGNIVDWLVAEGDTVEVGQTLAEVETDKATMELDSYFEGVLLHIAVKEGAVAVDGVIAVIGEEGEDWKAAIEADGGAAPAKAEAPKEEAPPASDSRIKASPLAKAMAKEAGIDISTITGSGEGGRIIKADIEKAKSAPAAAPAPAQPAAPAPAAAPAPNVPAFAFNAGANNFEDAPVSQMRKAVSRLVSNSKFTAPHFYVTVEINMGKVWEFRKRLNEVAPVKISFNDLRRNHPDQPRCAHLGCRCGARWPLHARSSLREHEKLKPDQYGGERPSWPRQRAETRPG